MGLPPRNPPLADVYIDESSQTGHRYLVLGGIIVPTADLAVACDPITAARLPELPRSTLKWGRVSTRKLDAYRRCVDAFFNLQGNMTLDYHALVVDTTQLNHALYNQGSREIGFNKEIYQLAMKFGRLYGALFHIYPDRRETDQDPADLRLMLNRGIKAKGDTRDWPYRRVQFREPEDCVLLQMTDVLTGAIAYRHNRHHEEPDASPAKIALSAHIMERAGIVDVFSDTATAGRFTLWHRQLRGVPRP